jgi:hypothetical protein
MEECGKDFRRATMHQRFCSDDCRYAHRNRKNRNAAQETKDEQYRSEVAAHEARINGYTLLELKANPPPQLEGPKLIRRPIRVQPNDEGDHA